MRSLCDLCSSRSSGEEYVRFREREDELDAQISDNWRELEQQLALARVSTARQGRACFVAENPAFSAAPKLASSNCSLLLRRTHREALRPWPASTSWYAVRRCGGRDSAFIC